MICISEVTPPRPKAKPPAGNDDFDVEWFDALDDPATIPRRAPLFRDEDQLNYGSDRADDDDWFKQHARRFRLVEATRGELRRAGVTYPLPDGWRGGRLTRSPGVRFARQGCWWAAATIVFAVRVPLTAELNAYSDAELETLWRMLLSTGHQIEIDRDCNKVFVEEGARP